MSFLIEKDESSSGRRTVPFRLYNSDGTGPVTGASNGTMLGSLNGAAQLSLGSISVVSANAGMYSFAFTQSNVSVLGSWALYTDTIATAFPQHVATAQVVNFNPMSTQSDQVLSTAGNRSVASSWFSSNLGNGRVAQEFLWAGRNRVTISGLTMTVYLPDDTTSAYTMSVTTSTNAVATFDGGGRA